MTHLTAWANRHAITPQAFQDLLYTLGLSAPPATVPPPPAAPNSEAAVQTAVRLAAAKQGILLWRNNTGAAKDEAGRLIRYGLCNDSAALGKVCKSSDLIGIDSQGRFVALECKAPSWKYRESDERARAQLSFINLINSRGGIARFVTSARDLETL